MTKAIEVTRSFKKPHLRMQDGLWSVLRSRAGKRAVMRGRDPARLVELYYKKFSGVKRKVKKEQPK